MESYATIPQRQVIDIAAKIVRHAGKIILKVTEAAMVRLQVARLWARSNSPPQFVWA